MLRTLPLLPLILLLAACAKPPYTNLDNAGLQALLDKGVPLYDIRRPEEWRQTGVVEGSHPLTFVDATGRLDPNFLPRLTESVGKDDPLILICRTGNRSDVLARLLVNELGYSQVYNVHYGIMGWLDEGRPVVRQ